jgi:hypothetical protein
MNAKHAISAALQLRHNLLGFASNFQSPMDVFADNKQWQKLNSPDWQIIYGRRGAGKTTLLARYAQYITRSRNIKSASIEINVPDFAAVITNGHGRSLRDVDIAQVYFADFIRYIANHLMKVFIDQNRDSKFVFMASNLRKDRYIHDLVVRIHNSTLDHPSIDIGASREGRRNKRLSHTQKNRNDSKMSGDVSIGVSGFDASVKAKLASEVSEQNNESVIETEIVRLQNYKFEYNVTRKLIQELLDTIGIDKLYIFIDEWSELDRTGNSMVQPYFAELLKRVLWKNPRFVVKIGAVRNQTRLNASTITKGIVGLEASADIFEIDLDSIYAGHELNKITFFEDLIFRHLRFCSPELSAFQTPGAYEMLGALYSRPLDTFISYIFKSRRELATLIRGSGALPRDFFEILDRIARAKEYSVDSPWTHRDVNEAIRGHYIANKQPGIGLNSDAEKVWSAVMSLVKTNDSRLVLCSRDANRRTMYGCAELYHRRLLHDVSPTDVPGTLRGKYFFYYVDMGLRLDLARDRIEDGEHEDACPLHGAETPHEVKRYVIGNIGR